MGIEAMSARRSLGAGGAGETQRNSDKAEGAWAQGTVGTYAPEEDRAQGKAEGAWVHGRQCMGAGHCRDSCVRGRPGAREGLGPKVSGCTGTRAHRYAWAQRAQGAGRPGGGFSGAGTWPGFESG